jgi:hypothetical protein
MTTVSEALHAFRTRAGLAPHQATQQAWTCGFGPVALSLPNFPWRRKAIERHDAHHVLTGYPCTLAGEISLSAWEFGAGRFDDTRATLFCLPLIAAGTLTAPRQTFAAFARGRIGRSLYSAELSDALLNRELAELQMQLAPPRPTPPRFAEALMFGCIAVQAFALVLSPFIAAVAVTLAI